MDQRMKVAARWLARKTFVDDVSISKSSFSTNRSRFQIAMTNSLMRPLDSGRNMVLVSLAVLEWNGTEGTFLHAKAWFANRNGAAADLFIYFPLVT